MPKHRSSGGPRIVIIGGGFAGAYCAQELERRLRPGEADVLLIDRNNYFVFYPLLVEAGTGSLDPRHAVVSLRSFVHRTRFEMGELTDIDAAQRQVVVRLPETDVEIRHDYDHVVLALGSVTRLPQISGLAEHGFQLKSLADAVVLRDRAIRKLEAADVEADPAVRARLLHFVVVGANFTGVEVAGEFHVFLRRACKLYPNLSPDEVRVTMVELGERILPALEPDLAEYALRALRRRGVRVELGTSAVRIEAHQAVLEDGQVLDADTVIWCAGIAPSPTVQRLGLPVDRRGYILADRELRVEGLDGVWAIGDAAVNRDADGVPYPATAQHAVRQGQHLARNLVRALRGLEPEPCDIRSLGALAALGCRTGVAEILGVKLSGFAAWFLWRTVYLMKMPGVARRVRVALDWTVDLFFPRDPVQIGLSLRRRSLKEGGENVVVGRETSSR